MARSVEQYKQLLSGIKQKKFTPVYFLYGKEPFFIDQLAGAIKENALNESEREFNLTTMYGLEADPQKVINAAKRYPMMAERQVVLLKEAHKMQKISALLPYIKQPVETTVLVICYKKPKIDKRTKFGKAIQKHATTFFAKPVYDNQLPAWITAYVEDKGYAIQPEATVLLGEQLGTDLSKVANELEKLMLNVPDGEMITPEAIEKNIGISRDYNTFELQNALAVKDSLKANKIARYFADNPKASPLPLTLGALYNFFSNLYTYHHLSNTSWGNVQKKLGLPFKFFAKDYEKAVKHYTKKEAASVIRLLHHYDLRSKGINNTSTDEGALLQELVYKILHLNQLKQAEQLEAPHQ